MKKEHDYPKSVDIAYFDRTPKVVHKEVTGVVLRKVEFESREEFLLGFLPHNEVMYKFTGFIPDITFRKMSVDRVYYEPYRTFIYLKKGTDISIFGSSGVSKLTVEGLKAVKNVK